MTKTTTGYCQTPIGRIEIAVAGTQTVSIRFVGGTKGAASSLKNAALKRRLKEVADYFAGMRMRFAVPETRGTAFEKRVWKQIARIPASATMSYKEVARRVGRPRAVRAVANACGKNPLPIVVPCHRVIRSGGGLGGYSGGLHRKRWLLAHEGVRAL